jgi:hypothetical protein
MAIRRGHGSEGSALEVHVESGGDHAHAHGGQLGAHLGQAIIEELGLIDAHHFDLAGEEQKVAAAGHGGAANGVAIVTDHIGPRRSGCPHWA